MFNMIGLTRDSIINVTSRYGFEVVTKPNKEDLYKKLLALRHATLTSNIYIDKTAGISKAGEINYLKVAVHPEIFSQDFERSCIGINSAINQKTKINLHSHSGFSGFPYVEGYNEPVAKAYKVDDLESLVSLLLHIIDS